MVSKHRLRRSLVTGAVAAVAAVVTVLPATAAHAMGNNREVFRSCGSNWVSSGYVGTSYSWAQTSRHSGDCSGRLSAALERSNGYWSGRTYGTSDQAYRQESGINWASGLHWGCDACNVTRS